MGHPDFRVDGKIFATLGYPDEGWSMVKFTPAQQQEFIKKARGVFVPCSGAWGQRGATSVNLRAARAGMIRSALDAAWGNVAAERAKD